VSARGTFGAGLLQLGFLCWFLSCIFLELAITSVLQLKDLCRQQMKTTLRDLVFFEVQGDASLVDMILTT
jgi:hypothetical protein